MYEYIFLYALAFLAILFAVVQDFRFREISNWVTFSLISFVLAYRLIYSIFYDNLSFFLFGLGGVIIFVIFGYLLYYGRVFAGGDAKLLFGLGGIFPYNSLADYLFYGFGFVLFLLLIGVAYTLIYSFFIAFANWNKFFRDFRKNVHKNRWLFFLSLVAGLFILFTSVSFFYSIVPMVMFIVFIYAKSLESTCMIKLVSPEQLTEGDWLVSDIKLGKKVIHKTVHGLSYEEIILLRKNKKNVWIKSGVPFAPAFLFALIFFMYFKDSLLNLINLL
ncbi:MAG: prepilin peptidase [Candidatus Pacearchaeota archaeon]